MRPDATLGVYPSHQPNVKTHTAKPRHGPV